MNELELELNVEVNELTYLAVSMSLVNLTSVYTGIA